MSLERQSRRPGVAALVGVQHDALRVDLAADRRSQVRAGHVRHDLRDDLARLAGDKRHDWGLVGVALTAPAALVPVGRLPAE